MAHWMDGIFEPSRTRSSSMDMESVHAMSPFNTPPTDAALEIYLQDSAKVKGSLDTEAKPTVDDAEELGLGMRRKTRTDKGKHTKVKGA